ncbi:hypothetical protein V2J56_08140 [Georgenia sp. MJ206]|uniref:hypothetical protein n=1 Tax=Georgenia wangjunii TaxID=3117730 RepID=UPI002F265EA0
MSVVDSHGREGRIAALSVLHQTETSSNVGELQATTAISLGLLTYLAATIFLFDDLAPELLALLPLGVLFGCSYQMLRAAVVVRRAALTRAYERCLAEAIGFPDEYAQGKLGSPFYASLDDIGVIRERREPGWLPRLFVAAVAYLGLYGLSVLYTTLVLIEVWDQVGAAWLTFGCTIAYAIFWLGFLVAAFISFQPRSPSKLHIK